MSEKWDNRFFSLAQTVAEWSKDPNTKVGAVIVSPDRHIISTGYNGFPVGVEDLEQRWESPEKYCWVVHAELNAICQASRRGAKLSGSTLYTTLFTCADCAKAVIQSGIIRIVSSAISEDRKAWHESWRRAGEMYVEANVKVRWMYE